MKIYEMQQGSEEWFDIKTGKFSGSRFDKIMSAKTTKGYQDELYRVAYERITGERIEGYINEAMRYGTETEPKAREWYENETGILVREVGFIEVNDFVGISPDGLVGDDGGVEFKCPQYNTQIDYLLKNKLPSAYKWQVYGFLWATGRTWIDFVSFYDSDKIDNFKIRVNRDEKVIKELESKLEIAVEKVKEIINKLEKNNVN